VLAMHLEDIPQECTVGSETSVAESFVCTCKNEHCWSSILADDDFQRQCGDNRMICWLTNLWTGQLTD